VTNYLQFKMLLFKRQKLSMFYSNDSTKLLRKGYLRYNDLPRTMIFFYKEPKHNIYQLGPEIHGFKLFSIMGI